MILRLNSIKFESQEEVRAIIKALEEWQFCHEESREVNVLLSKLKRCSRHFKGDAAKSEKKVG